jgi:hypothetical protein
MTRRGLFVLALLTAVTGGGTYVQANGLPVTIAVEPRIVEARLASMSLEQVDVDLRVALRGSHAATIRSIAFTDAFVGRVPVWIAPVAGRWPLRPDQELEIPEAVRVRVRARDAVGADDFGAIVRRGSVPVRASVEVAVATPWVGRLFFMPPTQTVVRQVTIDLPVQTPGAYLGPLARLGADLADVAQRGAAWLGPGLDRLAGRDPVVARVGGVVASVATRYAIEAGGVSTPRERRAAGVWWRPDVFCTTREAIEPWRFDVADATALQITGGRLRRDEGSVRIGATRDHPVAVVDLAALEAVLPAPAERKVYTLVDGRPRRLRLGDREAAANLACLRIGDAGPSGSAAPLRSAVPAPAGDVAAFAPGSSIGLAWTRIDAADGDRLRLGIALHRPSFGSPLVAGDRLAGVVASPTTAWSAGAVDAAATRAPRLPARPAGGRTR